MGNSIQGMNQKDHKILTDQEMDLLLNTSITWEKLRHEIPDQESFDKLILEVYKAKNKNENIAQLKTRLEVCGGKVMRIAKKIYFLVEENN